ncbi:DUF3887 domain-containing protein [candidate division WOR-3 bacterium]|nr:DUF3887 domain-containing protein [candidate division WOR-3 bacterium]
MKIVQSGVVCLLFCIACGVREQAEVIPSIDLTSRAQDFVTMLSQGDYIGCVATFDETMKTGLPEPKLQEAWNTIQIQVGNFEKQIGLRQTREAGYEVVYVTCQFEKGKIDVKVVYNGAEEVTGLWFRPAP